MFEMDTKTQQERIPVGCVPPARYRTGGSVKGCLCQGGSP